MLVSGDATMLEVQPLLIFKKKAAEPFSFIKKNLSLPLLSESGSFPENLHALAGAGWLRRLGGLPL